MKYPRSFGSDFLEKMSLVIARSLALLLSVGLMATTYRAMSEGEGQSSVMVQAGLFVLLLSLCFRSSKVSWQLRSKIIVGLAIAAALSGVIRISGVSYTTYAFLLFASGLSALVVELRMAMFVSLLSTLFFASAGHFLGDGSLLRTVAQFFAVFGLSAALIYSVSSLVQQLRSSLDAERQLRQSLEKEQQQLKQQQEQFSLLASVGQVGLFDYEFGSGELLATRPLLERIGIDADQQRVSLQSFIERMPESAQSTFIGEVERASQLSPGESFEFKHPQYDADGSLRTISVKGVLVERQGRLMALGSSVDITSETAAAAKVTALAANLEAVSQAGGVGVIEYYPQTGIMEVNAEVCRRLGRAVSDNCFHASEYRKHLGYQDSVAKRSALNEELSQLPLGSVQRFDEVMNTADGKTLYLRIARKRFVSEEQERIVGVSVDVTAEHEAAQKAQQQAQQLELMAEGGKVGFFEVSLTKGTMSGNAVLMAREGLEPDAVVSMEQVVGRVPEAEREAFQLDVQRAIEAGPGAVTTFTHPYVTAAGETIHVRVHATTEMRDNELMAYGASVDITEELKAKEVAENQAAHLGVLTEQGKIGLFEFDLEHEVFYANSVICERMGLAPDAGSFNQEVLINSMPIESRASVIANIERGKRREVIGFHTSTVDQYYPDGSLHKLRIYEQLVERDGRPFFVGASVDVTEEVSAKERAEAAATSLKEQQDRQAQMYAVIGHELRTPAASLQMMLEDLEEGETLNSDLVGANIEQLLSVIDTLRAVAQPDRVAKAAYANVHLDEMLLQQAEGLTPLAQRNAVQLQTDLTGLTSQPVRIQKTLLQQVLVNLVKNALIHSGGSQIKLGASGELVDAGRKRIQIWVADDGKGMPDDRVEQLFEAFVRGSTEAEGTGLGLHICREIIQNMGGSLRYETAELGGACFVIELEVELAEVELASEEAAAAQASESQSPLQGLRVLLAEDNKTIQMLTQKMLTKQGAQVQVCDNGAEALAAYKPGAFDLVLSDIFMPQMNGYEFVAALREQGYRGKVIGLTAATIGEETDKMLASGADAVLSKPINTAALNAELAADAVDE
jgi:signal transduction histidine kinase